MNSSGLLLVPKFVYYYRCFQVVVMIKRLLIVLLIFLCTSAFSQTYPKNCPAYPQMSYFDTTCYLYVDEIKLGQGRISHPSMIGPQPKDIYVPANMPEWAIASAHGWQLMKNMFKNEVTDIHIYFLTALKESQWSGDATMNFDGLNLLYPIDEIPEHTGAPHGDGFYHMGDGYAEMQKKYPHRHKSNTFNTYNGGNNFVRGMLTKVHYDAYWVTTFDYLWGYDFFGFINNTTDPFAKDILAVGSWNKGFNPGNPQIFEAFEPISRAGALATNDFPNFNVPSGNFQYTGGYGSAVKRGLEILNNQYTGGEANNEWHSWYDGGITWETMDAYMETIFVMYPELSTAEKNAIKTIVQTKYNEQDADNNNSVSFRFEFGPVLDAYIIAMPYDNPMSGMVNSQDTYSGCSGCIGPVVSIQANGPTVICEGLSVELETIYGSDFTYQWY